MEMAIQHRDLVTGLILHANDEPKLRAWAFSTDVASYGIWLILGTMCDSSDNVMIEVFGGLPANRVTQGHEMENDLRDHDLAQKIGGRTVNLQRLM